MNTVSSTHPPPAGLPALDAPAKFLSFELGTETYGIDIGQVQEVRSYERATPLPNAPAWLLGVTNLRGTIVPIIDLRTRLGMAAPFDARTVTAVLTLSTRCVGLVVDAVSDVVTLAPESIKPAPALEAHGNVDASFIQGIASVDDRMLILVDITALLSAEDAGGALSMAAAEQTSTTH